MCEALEPMKMEGRAEKAAAVEFKKTEYIKH